MEPLTPRGRSPSLRLRTALPPPCSWSWKPHSSSCWAKHLALLVTFLTPDAIFPQADSSTFKLGQEPNSYPLSWHTPLLRSLLQPHN